MWRFNSEGWIFIWLEMSNNNNNDDSNNNNNIGFVEAVTDLIILGGDKHD